MNDKIKNISSLYKNMSPITIEIKIYIVICHIYKTVSDLYFLVEVNVVVFFAIIEARVSIAPSSVIRNLCSDLNFKLSTHYVFGNEYLGEINVC